MRIAEGAASALGLTVLPVAVKGPRRDDLDRAFATIERERLGSLFVIGDSTLGVQRDRLPTSASHSRWAEGGLLMSYGTDFVDLFRRSASALTESSCLFCDRRHAARYVSAESAAA